MDDSRDHRGDAQRAGVQRGIGRQRAAIAELDAPQLRAMLAHELAHLERRDPQWLAFACILERAFFFQPLNRLARRGILGSARMRNFHGTQLWVLHTLDRWLESAQPSL